MKNFARIYYSWENNMESIERRSAALESYLTQRLQNLNVDTIRVDIPTSSVVNDVQILEVRQAQKNKFKVAYTVVQDITEEGQVKGVSTSYETTVYREDTGGMVIIQNPTLASGIQKSAYEPQIAESDSTIDAETIADATAFLNTFFQIYPKATDKELSYYVKGRILKPIGGEYLFSELVSPVFAKVGENIRVSLYVKYLDQQTKVTQISQYDWMLKKDENWMIIR